MCKLKVDDLTANRVCITDGSYNLASSTITSGELDNLLNCNSNIRTQLDDKSILIDSDNGGTQRDKPIIVMGELTLSTGSNIDVSFFDTNLFTTPPIMLGIVARDFDGQNNPNFGDITTSGFTCRFRGNAGTGRILWIAIGY